MLCAFRWLMSWAPVGVYFLIIDCFSKPGWDTCLSWHVLLLVEDDKESLTALSSVLSHLPCGREYLRTHLLYSQYLMATSSVWRIHFTVYGFVSFCSLNEFICVWFLAHWSRSKTPLQVLFILGSRNTSTNGNILRLNCFGFCKWVKSVW